MKLDMEDARKELKSLLRLKTNRNTVYTILRHKSRLSAVLSFVVVKNNEIINIDYLVAAICGYSASRRGGLRIREGGMDMGYHAVYSLSVALYCPKKYKKKYRNGNMPEAYRLKQFWL